MEVLVVLLLNWIVAKTGLIAPDPPRIIFMPTQEMIELGGGAGRPQALYKNEDRTVYLRDDWTPDTLLNKAVLLHELAHHVQKENKVPAECERAYEAEAYHLEIQWLREQGVDDPYAFLDTNEFAIILRSMCIH